MYTVQECKDFIVLIEKYAQRSEDLANNLEMLEKCKEVLLSLPVSIGMALGFMRNSPNKELRAFCEERRLPMGAFLLECADREKWVNYDEPLFQPRQWFHIRNGYLSVGMGVVPYNFGDTYSKRGQDKVLDYVWANCPASMSNAQDFLQEGVEYHMLTREPDSYLRDHAWNDEDVAVTRRNIRINECLPYSLAPAQVYRQDNGLDLWIYSKDRY
ncbi:MAG: hypothetical protein OEY01_03410 [Desulfobulbaceae bacterium]|nr:hypothetical protein [Desulfobulbaceae bacterium]